MGEHLDEAVARPGGGVDEVVGGEQARCLRQE